MHTKIIDGEARVDLGMDMSEINYVPPDDEEKWKNCYSRANTETMYLLDERVAIKMDSGISEMDARKQSLDEYFKNINKK